MKFIYYSLANSPDSSREKQWIQSIRSLRLYNPTIPVWLFLFNGATAELLHEVERWSVHVQFMGEYSGFLQLTHARGSVLAAYPTFHKFLVLDHAPLHDFTRILYLDCDTFFFDDVELLFAQYSNHEWYAREEPMTRQSQFGCNPAHVDEPLLEHIARCEGLRWVLPFNSGVCMLNHGIWKNLEQLAVPYLDLAWRLLCGCELNSHNAGLVHDPQIQQAVRESASDFDRSHALPYPSTNIWIIDQIALWLALGHLPRFSIGVLSRAQVPQGGEFNEILASGRRCIVAHYYNNMETEFFSAVPSIAV